LQTVEGDEKETIAREYNRVTFFEILSNLRQQDIGMSPAGLGPENDCADETSSNCISQTRDERPSHINKSSIKL
jgi:hypothetical protein